MKELSIEEKAKRYDKAVEIAKEINNEQRAQPFNIMTRVFPELRESEDERIRKALINGFNKLDKSAVWYNGITNGQILAWLENHEQKPDGWSEEDRTNLQRAVYYVDFYQTHEADTQDSEECMNWLKSLKDRIQPRPKQEWSEEDETGLTNTIIMLKEGANLHFNKKDITKAVDWLKSLRPQNRWKPSDEQIIELRRVISGCSYDIEPLVEIEEHLKSL